MLRTSEHLCLFVHGDRFASEGRLIDLELGNLQQAQVGRDLVAGFQQHNVSRHKRMRSNLLHLSTSDHGSLGCCHALQSCQRLVRAPGLDQTNGGVEHHDGQNHQGVDQVPDHAGDQCRGQQHQNHEVAELVQQQRPKTAALALGQGIGAVLLGTLRHLICGQTVLGVYPLLACQFHSIAQMPQRTWRLCGRRVFSGHCG